MWDFISDRILGMKWLNEVTTLLLGVVDKFGVDMEFYDKRELVNEICGRVDKGMIPDIRRDR